MSNTTTFMELLGAAVKHLQSLDKEELAGRAVDGFVSFMDNLAELGKSLQTAADWVAVNIGGEGADITDDDVFVPGEKWEEACEEAAEQERRSLLKKHVVETVTSEDLDVIVSADVEAVAKHVERTDADKAEQAAQEQVNAFLDSARKWVLENLPESLEGTHPDGASLVFVRAVDRVVGEYRDEIRAAMAAEAEARIFGGCGVPAAKMLTKTEMFAAIEQLLEPMRSRARDSIGRELLLKEYGIDLDEERQKMLEEQARQTAKAAAQAAPLILNVPWGYPLVDFELPVSRAARKWIDQHFCSALEGYNLFLEGQEFRDEVARAVDMVKNQLAPEISAVKRIWPEVPLCIIRKAAAWVDAHPDEVRRGAFPLAMCPSTRQMIDAIIEHRTTAADKENRIPEETKQGPINAAIDAYVSHRKELFSLQRRWRNLVKNLTEDAEMLQGLTQEIRVLEANKPTMASVLETTPTGTMELLPQVEAQLRGKAEAATIAEHDRWTSIVSKLECARESVEEILEDACSQRIAAEVTRRRVRQGKLSLTAISTILSSIDRASFEHNKRAEELDKTMSVEPDEEEKEKRKK